MAGRPFPTHPNYVQSVQGLHRLHALEMAGKNEGPEADAVRDRLERPWTTLSEVEKTRITGLSEDLRSMSEPPGPPPRANPQDQRTLEEASEACQAGDWDRALDVLRRCRFLDPAVLSKLRGDVWQEAGDGATAALFFEHAARLAPSDAEELVRLHTGPDQG